MKINLPCKIAAVDAHEKSVIEMTIKDLIPNAKFLDLGAFSYHHHIVVYLGSKKDKPNKKFIKSMKKMLSSSTVTPNEKSTFNSFE